MGKIFQFLVVFLLLAIIGIILFVILTQQPEPKVLPKERVPLKIDPKEISLKMGTTWYSMEDDLFIIDEDLLLSTIYDNDYNNIITKEDAVNVFNNLLWHGAAGKHFAKQVATEIVEDDSEILNADNIHDVMTKVQKAGEYKKVIETN